MPDKVIIENAKITDKGVVGKQSKDGKDYAAFTIMWSSGRKDRATGQWDNGPTKFVNVKVFGFQKYDLVSSLKAGDRVNVSGNIEHFEWQSDQGPKDDWTLFADSVTLPVPRADQQQSAPYNTQQRQSPPAQSNWGGTPQGGAPQGNGGSFQGQPHGNPQGGFGQQPPNGNWH